MKLIRWLLSNIILIAFVLALTYAYVYWDNLTGEDTPAGKAIAYLSVEYDEVREFLDSYDFSGDASVDALPPEPAADAVETASVPQVMPPTRPQTRPPAQQGPMSSQSMQQPVPQQAFTQPQPMRQQQPMQPPQAMMQQRAVPPQVMMQPQPSRQPAPQPPAMRQQQPMQPQAMIQQQAEPPQARMQPPPPRQPPARPGTSPGAMTQEAPAGTQMQQPTPSTGGSAAVAETPKISTRELWVSAREEYHRGNLDESIRNYQQVIANSTDNYDAYGEMGNVYLRKGNPGEAASAYFEAASILVKMGQLRRASSLIPMLERLDRAKAEELNQLLSNTSRS
jgi:hypothetical protein